MTFGTDHRRQLSRMQEARRQTHRQLDMLDRQITRRMTALILSLLPRRTHYRRGKAPDPGAFLASYRAQLAALTADASRRSMPCRASWRGRTGRSPCFSTPATKTPK